jgi:hypothetical protein
MVADRAFVHELRLLDPDLFAVWHPKVHRWQLRQWILPHGRGAERHYGEWRVRSVLIRTVCYRDEEYHDIGYHPLDQRVLYAQKLSQYYSADPNKTAAMVDEHNKKLEDAWDADNADISREVARSIYSHYREPSIDLGRRSAR